jgi:hypothetical protein
MLSILYTHCITEGTVRLVLCDGVSWLGACVGALFLAEKCLERGTWSD